MAIRRGTLQLVKTALVTPNSDGDKVVSYDADAGEVVNVAIVTAVDEGGQTLTADDDETVGVVEVLDVVQEKPQAKPLEKPQAKTGAPISALLLLGAMLTALGAMTIRRTPRRSGGIRG